MIFDIQKKRIELALSQGRVPLSKTHIPESDLAGKILEIKKRLERINKLMNELKEVSK